MNVPADLRYTSDHEWARASAEGVQVGITAFAADQLGAVVFVELPKVGDHIKAGSAFGQVESTKSVSDLYAPLSGKVVAVNAALESSPEQVNDDPYGAGWMIQLAPDDPDAVHGLLSADGYRALIG